MGSRMRQMRSMGALIVAGLVAASTPGLAQGRRGGHHSPPPAAAGPDDLKPIPPPTQRLDPGATLCHTEAALQSHQAAIQARLDGTEAREQGGGCRIIGSMTPVGVVQRHGLDRTQVRLPGPPEETGWTDSVVHSLK